MEVDLRSSDKTGTTIPLVVANMTAIAGRRMAETVARRGGLVVIPQDIPFVVVKDVIHYVKSRHTLFDTPITLSPSQTVADAASLLHKRAHGAVVIVEDNKPVGIVTEEDLNNVDRFTQLAQVMSKELTTMPDTVDPRQAFDFLNENRRTLAPVVGKNGELVGIITKTGALRATLYSPAVDKSGKLLIATAVGINGDVAQKAAKLVEAGADVIVVDTAHGHQKKMIEALEGSLRRLQTDCIDLYQIHWPDRPMPWGSNPTAFKAKAYEGSENSMLEALETLQTFVKQGKIRFIGLSNESSWGTMQFLKLAEKHGLPRVETVQNAYNLLNRTYETGLAEISMREQVGLLAFSPLAQGYLTGKYLNGARPAGARSTLFNRGQRYETPNAEPAIKAYVDLAHEIGWKPEELALSFVNSRAFLGSTIIGATTMDQLRINIASIEKRMTEDIENRINAIHHCYCNPCP